MSIYRYLKTTFIIMLILSAAHVHAAEAGFITPQITTHWTPQTKPASPILSDTELHYKLMMHY